MTTEIHPEDLTINLWNSEPRTGMQAGMQAGMPRGVQIIHLPSGIVVQYDKERNMHRNKEIALQKLKEQLKVQVFLSAPHI